MASINRRTVLTGAVVAGRGRQRWAPADSNCFRRPGPSESSAAGGGKPNILVIVVDQMRAPQWFPEPARVVGTVAAHCTPA